MALERQGLGRQKGKKPIGSASPRRLGEALGIGADQNGPSKLRPILAGFPAGPVWPAILFFPSTFHSL
ncbi:MAG: hypothetical protein DBY06_03345 [Clostridiales bacterium]|nr:MAG: hypothetical protein DBY06_03345 [Clostridiales bacterium]